MQRPIELNGIQFVNASSAHCLEEIRISITEQLARLGEAEASEAETESVKYRRRRFYDRYDGIPGYEINVEYVTISSEDHPSLENANDAIKGEISRSIMDCRSCAISPDSSLFNIGQARWSRTNTLDWVLSEVVTSGRILSVVYTVHHYMAGAVHPVSGIKTFNFFLSPMIEAQNFEAMIEDKSCLPLLQSTTRTQLYASLRSISDSEPDEEWIADGTKDWSCFKSFSIRDENIVFYFGSYQVAAYAFGHQTVTIPARDLAPYMTEFAANSLDLGWVRRNARLS